MTVHRGEADCVLSDWTCSQAGRLRGRSVVIKINYQSPPRQESPRTDLLTLRRLIETLLHLGCSVSLIEGADGKLGAYLERSSLGYFIRENDVGVIDIDTLDDFTVLYRRGRRYALPNLLRQFDVRIALPCASKRPGYLFSCNVKTFVGLLPRKLCGSADKALSGYSRPMIHENLTETIVDTYELTRQFASFDVYINGGNTFSEYSKIRDLGECYVSDNPVELDLLMARELCCPPPDYLRLLQDCRD